MTVLRLLVLVAVLGWPCSAGAQRLAGELRVQVTDASGAPVAAIGTIEGAATQVRREFAAGADGTAVVSVLPFGRYDLVVERAGFATVRETVTIESALPVAVAVTLGVAPVQAAVRVVGAPEHTLINGARTGSLRYVGSDWLAERLSASPGRSLIDLVNMQPGWLLEANGILHARGSEYQVQYVIDGIPLRDNRSPAFAQSLGVEEFDSLAIRTGGYPAEFGGKLGGVVEVNTARDVRDGVHGAMNVQVGSFATASGHGSLQYGTSGMRVGLSAEAMTTDRNLDPPTEDNFTNEGRAHGLAGRFERAWSAGTRTRIYAYGRSTRFQVPNDRLQQAAGQRQERTADERLAQVSHQAVLAPSLLLNAGAMMRRTGATLASNAFSVPVRASQDRGFTEGYVNGSVTVHRGAHEVRAGGEATFANLREQFAFDADDATSFSFEAEQPLREQALFVQDMMRVGQATISVGLRYDHHRLVASEHAWSPRLSASWLAAPRIVFHAAYDRTFETPPIENLLIASTDLSEELEEADFRPLRSSRGHFVEAGAAWTVAGQARVEATWFQRHANDVIDDELLMNTAISFPVAFASATVRGLEVAVDAPRWRTVSGTVTYSLSKGTGRLPLTGGLFLDADEEDLAEEDEFELSQDQRHTLRVRLRTDVGGRGWLTGVLRYDSGLPVEIEGDAEIDVEAAAEQYGAEIVKAVDFEAGRVRYGATLDLSAGMRLLGGDTRRLTLQVDVFNVFDRLNVINFAGLLSGTAIAPRRSFAVRLSADF